VQTVTTYTAASKVYSLILGLVAGAAPGGTAITLDNTLAPHCVAMDALTAGSDDSTLTVPSTISVFVKGLL